MKERILLVGSYPPPYGGCSVHIARLEHALRERFLVDVIDLYGDPQVGDGRYIVRCGRKRPGNVLRGLAALRLCKAPLAHFHVAGMDAFLFASLPMLAVLPRRTRKVLTVHSGSFVKRFRDGRPWRRALLQRILRSFCQIVTVNEEQRRFLQSLGVEAGRISVIPAFLPPVSTETPRAREAIASLNGCERILVASGYGLDYYGFDVILDALERLPPEEPRTGLLICTYNSYDESYMATLSRRGGGRFAYAIVRDLNPGEFAWVLQRSDAYVRATDRDGDAVAIREAMYFDKAVIASDCVERPPQAILFRTNDSESLRAALMAAAGRRQAGSIAGKSAGLLELLDVYRKALSA